MSWHGRRTTASSIERHRKPGLSPAPKEIDLSCSCPDSAFLCKHIAAVLFGVGARLDQKPELFFTLRSVAVEELVAKSALHRAAPAKEVLDTDSLEGIFGIEHVWRHL